MPIDERAMLQCDEQEFNLQILKGWLGYGQLGLPMPNRRVFLQWPGGSRTRSHQGSGTAAKRWSWPLCRFAYRAVVIKSAPAGFGPAVSCVTSGPSTPGCSTRACWISSGPDGTRTLKAHRSAAFGTAAIASWLALPLRLRWQELNLRRGG